MSKNVDRNQVFQNIRVRTSLKNDASWIQKSDQKNKEQDDGTRADQAVETRPILHTSYVLSTAKKFESLDSPPSPPFQKTQFIPSEGPQAPTEELIQNGETQPEKSVNNSTAANKDGYADASRDQSNIEHKEAAEVSADVHVKEHIPNGKAQPVSSTKENPEAVSPVEPEEEPIVNSTPQNKGKYADTAFDQSDVEHSEVSVSAGVHVEGPVAETSAAAGTEESKNIAEVLAVLAFKLRPLQEEPPTKTEPENATHLEDAGGESAVEPAEKGCDKQAAEKTVEAVEVVAESLPDKSGVVNATPGEEAALQDSVEAAPDLLEKYVSELSTAPAPAAETAAEGSCEKGPPEKAAGEPVVAVAKANMESLHETLALADASREVPALEYGTEAVPDLLEKSVSKSITEPADETATEGSCKKVLSEQANLESSPKTSAVTDASREVPALKYGVEPVPYLLAKSVSESSTETATEGSCKKCPPEKAAWEPVEAVGKTNVESSPETPAVSNASAVVPALKNGKEAVLDLLEKSLCESSPVPAAETATKGSCKKGSQEKAAGEPVEAVAKANVESSPETPAVSDALGEQAALQDRVEPVPDLVTDSVSELLTQPESAVQSVECKVEPAASAEAVLQTRPAENTVVEQSVEPTPESAEDHVVELSMEDAVEPVTASDAEAVQDRFANSIIELTDALDVEPPTTEAAPEPLKDPEQSHTEDTKVSQQSDNTNISEMCQKPVEELQSTQTPRKTRNINNVCSFCDKIIDGYVKITFSEPLVTCHPDCLQCGVCAKALGDLLTPMVLHNQVIICNGCFAMTL